MKALIVGGGIAGLSTAWALARRGVTVELFEQGPLPNPRASSYDEHRITRHAYGRMEGYAHLMPEAFRVWDQLWQATGTSHYEPCGAVYFLRREDGLARRRQPLPGRNGHRATRRPAGPGGAALPHWWTPPACCAWSKPRARACCSPCASSPTWSCCSAAWASRCAPARMSTRWIPSTAACGWATRPMRAMSSWWRRAPGRDRLVPGLRGVGVPSRQAVLYLSPPPDLAQAWAEAPVMLDLQAGGRPVYPAAAGAAPGSRSATTCSPALATRTRTASPPRTTWSGCWPAARATYRDLDRYAVLEPKACFYTVTEDEGFLVHPTGAAGWLVSACSGHGFKLGSLIGDLVGACYHGGKCPPPRSTELAAGRTTTPRWRQSIAA